jgi:hypothetical protein
MGQQWLGRLGKTDNGIVTVTTLWTDGRVYYPLHARPYTPAHHIARSRSDPVFRTKPQLAAALAARGKEAGFGCGQWSPTAPNLSVTTGTSSAMTSAYDSRVACGGWRHSVRWVRIRADLLPGDVPLFGGLDARPTGGP